MVPKINIFDDPNAPQEKKEVKKKKGRRNF